MIAPATGDVGSAYAWPMPDASLLECFPSPTSVPFVIEHVNEEFTSTCPKTGHPDFGRIILRYRPAAKCVELKSLKLYLQKYRDAGIFYENVTNRILEDFIAVVQPRRVKLVAEFSARGGITTSVTAKLQPALLGRM